MPRFFCDYCDAYLTHDSAPGRQQHIRGYKHRECFRNYYAAFYPKWRMQQEQRMQQLAAQGFPMPVLPPPSGAGHLPPPPGSLPQGMPPHAPGGFRPPPGGPPAGFQPPPMMHQNGMAQHPGAPPQGNMHMSSGSNASS